MTLADLQQTQDELAAVKAEIAAEEEKFDAAVAQLRGRQKELEAELEKGLMAELAAIGVAPGGSQTNSARKPRGKIDEDKIVAALREHPNISAGDIFGLIGASDLGISSGGLSQKLKSMVDRGVLTKTGDKRGTKYRAVD